MKHWLWAAALAVLHMSVVTMAADEKLTALPLPKNLRVESSGPLGQVWNTLDAKQKKLAYYLTQAGEAGRTLLFYQSHRHALTMRSVFKKAFAKNNLAKTKALLGDKAYAEMLTYTAKFFDQAGPYATSNRKYVVKETTPQQVDALFKKYSPLMSAKIRAEIVALMTNPDVETRQYPDDATGKGLEASGGNLYAQGITADEVKTAIAKGDLKLTLNCHVVRHGDKLDCPLQTVASPGFVGQALRKVVLNLRLALPYASTSNQRAEIERFITYFTKGHLEDFRQANISWVKDRSDSVVDFMLGWVEVYEDYLAQIASWESMVQVIDRKVSETAEALAKHAQQFENQMPYEDKYKKNFPKDYSPPAIMVYYFQEVASMRSGGYNLPNFDDIRRDVGAKNVIRLPLPGEDKDPEIVALYREMLTEFAPANKIDAELAAREKVWQNIVLMHEIIGHGSGVYNTEKYPGNIDPISTLGKLGSALEEQRADLTALTFMNDPILISIGVYKDADEAKQIRNLSYDYYLADFLRRTSGQRTFSEAHQRGHWLFVNQLLKAGAVGWEAKDGKSKATPDNQVLVVKDYDKFQQTARKLLGTLQDIKAERKEADLAKLFDTDAPIAAIDEPWAQAVIKRGENLKINAGYVEQPWRITPDMRFQTLGGKTLEAVAPYWPEYY